MRRVRGQRRRPYLAANYCGVCDKTAHASPHAAAAEIKAIFRRSPQMRGKQRFTVYRCVMGCWHVGKRDAA